VLFHGGKRSELRHCLCGFSDRLEVGAREKPTRLHLKSDHRRSIRIRLVNEGRLAFPVELITRHDHWYDIVWVKSDFGEGLVLLVQVTPMADHELLQACEHALAAATA